MKKKDQASRFLSTTVSRALNSASSHVEFALYAPFFFGAWLAGGLVLKNIFVFITISLVLFAAESVSRVKDRPGIPFITDLELAFQVAAAIGVLFLYSQTKHLGLSTSAALTAALIILSNKLKQETPRAVILKACARVECMGLLALLGILSQVYASFSRLVIDHAILGIPSGGLLAGALLIEQSKIFEQAGLPREKLVKKGAAQIQGKGQIRRPGRLTQLIAIFIIILPAIPVVLAPLGFLPSLFLVSAGTYYFVPQILQKFQERTEADMQLAKKLILLSIALSALLFVAGLFSQ